MTRAHPYNKQHRLSNLDLEAMTADCLVCGPVAVLPPVRKRQKLPQCENRYREERKYDSSYAKSTRSEEQRARKRELYHERHWLVALAKRYGVGVNYYPDKLEEQGGVCGVCKKDVPNQWGKYTLDHNHATGAARGLLCNNCNALIGYSGESVEVLLNAIDYLDKYPC